MVDAREWAARKALPEQRNVRSRLLSTARSYLFNKVLAARVADGSWQRAQVGDLLAFTDSRSFSLQGRLNAATRVWRSWTCTRRAHNGAKATRRRKVLRMIWNNLSLPANPTYVIGW